MSVRAHLKPFPIAAARSSPFGAVVLDNVNDLAKLAWKVKKWTLSFAISFDDGTGSVAVPIPDFTIEMGVSYGPTYGAYVTQKEILNYRVTRYQVLAGGYYDIDKTWDYYIDLGNFMFYGPVRDGAGDLITSGGDYEYQVEFSLTVTTDATSGNIRTERSIFTPSAVPIYHRWASGRNHPIRAAAALPAPSR